MEPLPRFSHHPTLQLSAVLRTKEEGFVLSIVPVVSAIDMLGNGSPNCFLMPIAYAELFPLDKNVTAVLSFAPKPQRSLFVERPVRPGEHEESWAFYYDKGGEMRVATKWQGKTRILTLDAPSVELIEVVMEQIDNKMKLSTST